MLNLMKKDFIAENIDEKILCNRLEQIKHSKDIKKFIKKIENIVNNHINIFAYRIKDSRSAIRTFRLAKYDSIDKMYDLLGFLFVVENENEIKKLEKKLIKKIDENNIEIFDLLKEKKYKENNVIEENIEENEYRKTTIKNFNQLIYIPDNLELVLPPFSYNLLIKKKFKDLDFNVPIEIRIQTKEDFIALESYYYTVHKNDTLSINTKMKLINIGFRLLRRMTKISFLFDSNEKDTLENEIKKIMDDNKEFIEENKDIFNLIFLENRKLINCWKNKNSIYEFEIIN